MEDIGLDYSLYLHEMYISCCLKRASHVARDVHLMQMDYRVEDGRGISCSRAEGEELVSDQGFDELPAEVRTHHTFHYCAQQESKQRAQPRLVEPLRDGFEDAGDEGPAFAFGLGQFVGDMLVVLGFEIAQGDVFEFALDVV